MNKKLFFILGVLLSLGMFFACSSDEEVSSVSSSPESGEKKDSIESESCISGTIIIHEGDEGDENVDNNVFIGYLTMPEGEKDKYNYIKTVVVPKDEFPFQYYQDGDIIDFNIVEVKSTFPPIGTGLFTPTAFLCSISLCK